MWFDSIQESIHQVIYLAPAWHFAHALELRQICIAIVVDLKATVTSFSRGVPPDKDKYLRFSPFFEIRIWKEENRVRSQEKSSHNIHTYTQHSVPLLELTRIHYSIKLTFFDWTFTTPLLYPFSILTYWIDLSYKNRFWK